MQTTGTDTTADRIDSGAKPAEWKAVHDRLSGLARRYASQDFEVGEALLQARRSAVHVHMGYGSLHEYVERLFGFPARQTNERLRVAEALDDLPKLAQALKDGRLSWSALREITRVAVAETQTEWLDFSSGKTVRDIEERVSGLRPGAGPDDPPDPRLRRKVLRFEVSPEGQAMFKDAIARLRREVDPRMTEEDALIELCRRSLGGSDEGRAPYQVALTVCERCERTWHEAGGESVEVPAEVGERAACDAQHIGHVADPQPPSPEAAQSPSTHVGPAPATQTIPPATRRKIHRRDKGRCRVPGCRNHIWLDVHHLHPREELGTHHPSNLLLLCGAHHDAQHGGKLVIEGVGEADARFFHADGTPYGEAPRPADVEASTEAHAALRALGFTETETRAALATARTHVGPGATTEALVTAALKRRHHGPAKRPAA